MHVYGRRRMGLLSSSWEAGDIGWYTNPSLSQTKCCSLFYVLQNHTTIEREEVCATCSDTHYVCCFLFSRPLYFSELATQEIDVITPHFAVLLVFFFFSVGATRPTQSFRKTGITKNYKKIYNIHIIYKKERKLKKGGNEWGVHYTVHLLKRASMKEKAFLFFSTLVVFFLHALVVFAIALIVFAS